MKNYYKSNVLLIAVSALVVFLIGLDVYMFRENPPLFWTTLPILVAVSGLTIGKLLQIRKNEYWYFEQLTDEIRGSDSMSLIGFPLPVAVVDKDRCVIWSNDCFNECFYTPNEDESSIDVVTEEPLELFGSEGREIEYNGRWYRVYTDVHEFLLDEHKTSRSFTLEMPKNIHHDPEKESITMMIFKEITDYKLLQSKHEKSKPVVMIVMVDDYEGMFTDAMESERSDVTSKVETHIEEYFSGKNAILRKISADRFFIVIESQYLREMIQDRFSLINNAHSIVVKDRAVVTLSIGVGTTAENLEQSERFAMEMLGKARDRGGDQAVVKKHNGFESFGAKTPGREHTGKVKIRLAAERMLELFKSADTVYIMGHAFADFDAAGAAIGLACALHKLGINANAVLSFRDERKTNAKPLIDMIRQQDPSVIMEPDEAYNWFTDKSVLVIVDTHITKKVESLDLFELASPERLVIIDHHVLSGGEIENYAVRTLESSASSASELVTELIQYFGINGNPLKKHEANALLSGIMLDTKDFVMGAGVSTFEAAAYLKKMGADSIQVKKLFDTSIDNKMKKSEIVSSAWIYSDNCAISLVTNSFPEIRVICSQAADDMLYIEKVDASFTVYPIEGGWSFSARSLGAVNVQRIMEKLGNKKDDGGGHTTMAGAQLYGITSEEAIEKLKKAIDEELHPEEVEVIENEEGEESPFIGG